MYFLCIDTSSKLGSLAIAKKKDKLVLVGDKQWMRSKDVKNKKVFSHAEFITTEFQKLLDENNLNLNDLEALLITHGPGSFTGLRVGLSFAKSLAYSLNLPIYSVDSLSAMAYALKDQPKNIHVVVNAQKNLVFYSAYSTKNQVLTVIKKPSLKSLDDIPLKTEDLYITDVTLNNQDLLLAEDSYKLPQAKTLIGLFNAQFDFFQKNQWNSLKPLYLKASEAEENLKKGLLKPLN